MKWPLVTLILLAGCQTPLSSIDFDPAQCRYLLERHINTSQYCRVIPSAKSVPATGIATPRAASNPPSNPGTGNGGPPGNGGGKPGGKPGGGGSGGGGGGGGSGGGGGGGGSGGGGS